MFAASHVGRSIFKTGAGAPANCSSSAAHSVSFAVFAATKRSAVTANAVTVSLITAVVAFLNYYY